jgi:NAD(P)-dependent dehydrogenase (short-subunit alcohol dehydrogenase family)
MQISAYLGQSSIDLDGVILSASPAITPLDWAEEWDEETLSFVGTASAMVLYPLRALLPRLRSPGFVIYISSEYVKRPRRYFAHYVAAKSAAEGLIRALAVEFPMHAFTIVRPPKMLTNQTNTAFDYDLPAQAEVIVGQMLAELNQRATVAEVPGVVELDLKAPE